MNGKICRKEDFRDTFLHAEEVDLTVVMRLNFELSLICATESFASGDAMLIDDYKYMNIIQFVHFGTTHSLSSMQ
jgi:hypothetical protein